MIARLRLWWQRIKKPLEVAVINFSFIILIALIIVIIIGYILKWGWTGLSQKTLWDWLQLLFIPTVLTLGAVWITAWQNHDREIAQDSQCEVALQSYIDKISELLLHENLRDSAEEDEVRNIARVRTLTVLHKLDPLRKRTVIRFLQESALIDKDNTIIDLRFANLRNADLYRAHLHKVNLNEVDLREADLREANLSEANLSGARVTSEQLDQAKSLQDAILPDGSKHP